MIGAKNADTGNVNQVVNSQTGAVGTVPEVAQQFKRAGVQFVIVAGDNYGEGKSRREKRADDAGSSREHAALQPRYLNGVAVIAKSFARIHESNLKKQGMLALTFADAGDYDRLSGQDAVSLVGLGNLRPGKAVTMEITPRKGEKWSARLNHTFNDEQIAFFRAGSALNLSRQLKGEARA